MICISSYECPGSLWAAPLAVNMSDNIPSSSGLKVRFCIIPEDIEEPSLEQEQEQGSQDDDEDNNEDGSDSYHTTSMEGDSPEPQSNIKQGVIKEAPSPAVMTPSQMNLTTIPPPMLNPSALL